MNTRKLRTPAVIAAAAGIAVFGLAACSSSSSPTNEATPEVTAPSGAVTSGSGQEIMSPVGFKTPVNYPSGLTVDVVKADRVTVAAQGPGEISGPGISFLIKLTNKSDSEIKLDNVAVNAFYGKGKTPASPAPTSATPFSGTLGKGMSTEAAYVFNVPSGADPVELQFSYATNAPVAVFVGKP
ncbi:MAG: hypothetical protein WA988_04350 [Candidatus Nanopelagicales bacterium]